MALADSNKKGPVKYDLGLAALKASHSRPIRFTSVLWDCRPVVMVAAVARRCSRDFFGVPSAKDEVLFVILKVFDVFVVVLAVVVGGGDHDPTTQQLPTHKLNTNNYNNQKTIIMSMTMASR